MCVHVGGGQCLVSSYPLPSTAFNLSVNMELTDWLEHARDPQVSISVLPLMYNPWVKLGC